jgi:hypothetical protein
MGTRSLTFVYNENNKPILNLYRQYDGYPKRHGAELAEFIKDIRITNGIRGDGKGTANGMGCLAAQIVAHFKESVGGFYIHAVSETDCGQDYEYHLYPNKIVVKEYGGRTLFSGEIADFCKFCSLDYEGDTLALEE